MCINYVLLAVVSVFYQVNAIDTIDTWSECRWAADADTVVDL